MGDQRRGETIGQRLRRLRRERGLSLRDLEEPGVSYAFISRIEAGDRKPSLRSIRALARRLGVSAHYLETGEPVPPDDERELAVSDAELELRLGRDLAKAEAVFRAELAEEPTERALTARAEAGLGLLAARRGDADEAVRLLEAAIGSGHLPPEARPDLYETLGRLYTSHGRASTAIELFERCLADVPDDAALRVRFGTYLAAAYSTMGAIEAARRVLDEASDAVEAVPVPQARTLVYWVRAFNEWKAGRSLTALTYMRRAIGLLESGEDGLQTARAHLVAAQMLTLDGRYRQAGEHLDRADALLNLGADPSDLAVLHAERAKVAAHEGDAEAMELAAEADRLVGGDELLRPVVAHALAAAHVGKGDLAGAEPYFREALEGLTARRQWREAARVAKEWAAALRSADRLKEALDMMEEATVLTARHVGSVQRRG